MEGGGNDISLLPSSSSPLAFPLNSRLPASAISSPIEPANRQPPQIFQDGAEAFAQSEKRTNWDTPGGRAGKKRGRGGVMALMAGGGGGGGCGCGGEVMISEFV